MVDQDTATIRQPPQASSASLRSGIPVRCPACRDGALQEREDVLACPACGGEWRALAPGVFDLAGAGRTGSEEFQREVYDERRNGLAETADPFFSFTTLNGWRFTRQLRRLKPAAGERLLEIGCAAGPLLKSLTGNSGAIGFGIDISPASVGAQLRRRGESTAYDVIGASAHALPFFDSAFDVVASFDVLEHLEHPEFLFREIARVLKPGGRALVRGAVLDFGLTNDWIQYSFFYKSWMEKMRAIGHFYENFRTKRRHVELAEAAGLKVKRVVGADLFFDNVLDYHILPKLYGLFSRRPAGAGSGRDEASNAAPAELRVPMDSAHRPVRLLVRQLVRLLRYSTWPEMVLARLGFGASAYFELRKP